MPYDITYTWNLKYGTNKPIYETETDSELYRTDQWLPKRRRCAGGMNWDFGISRYRLLYTE